MSNYPGHDPWEVSQLGKVIDDLVAEPREPMYVLWYNDGDGGAGVLAMSAYPEKLKDWAAENDWVTDREDWIHQDDVMAGNYPLSSDRDVLFVANWEYRIEKVPLIGGD